MKKTKQNLYHTKMLRDRSTTYTYGFYSTGEIIAPRGTPKLKLLML